MWLTNRWGYFTLSNSLCYGRKYSLDFKADRLTELFSSFIPCLRNWYISLINYLFFSHSYIDSCFPNPGINLYLSLLLPICLVMVHNFVIFSMVVCRLVFTDVAGKAVTQSRKQQLVTRLQNAMCMSVLMGLSWSLGLLVVAHPTFIFQLLFCIVNSLQGKFIIIKVFQWHKI